MKRLVSFSLASMLAMGMTAGAAVQPASANMKGWISSSEVQGMNKDEILQYLFEKFDISIGNDSPVQKPGTGGGSSQNPGLVRAVVRPKPRIPARAVVRLRPRIPARAVVR